MVHHGLYVDETAKLQQRRAAQAARMPTAAPCRTSCGSDDAGAPPPAPASSPSLNRTDRAAAARRATRRALVAIGALATWRHADMST